MLLENTELIQTAENIAEEKGIEKELVLKQLKKLYQKLEKLNTEAIMILEEALIEKQEKLV